MLEDWRPECVVSDGAPSHKGKQVTELAIERIVLPSYSPELRARPDGKVYASLAAKQAEAEADLQPLATDPERVERLCGWQWVVDAPSIFPPRARDGCHYLAGFVLPPRNQVWNLRSSWRFHRWLSSLGAKA